MQLISKKQFHYLLLSIALLIIFHKPIEEFISIIWVGHIAKYVEKIWYNDLFELMLITYLSWFFADRFFKKRYIPSVNLFLIFSVITGFYAYHRFFAEKWIFTSFSTFSKLKYADVLLLIFMMNVPFFLKSEPKEKIIRFCSKYKRKSKKNDENLSVVPFENDEPLGTSPKNSSDLLEYEEYARIVALKIQSSQFDKSFAIGINGKWGQGKTSFIYLVKKHLNDDQIIIQINFNPWNARTADGIIQDFFKTFKESISPYHSSLSNLIYEYANNLVTVDDNTYTQSLKLVSDKIAGNESLGNISKQIDDKLKAMNRKIIVYIDDLDRLDKKEVVEVIKLVRNTANFYNTFFLVAYDRDFVINAVADHNSHNKERFLEKIFQLEINLPYTNKRILLERLLFALKEQLPEELHETIKKTIFGEHFFEREYEYLFDWIENLRDVVRISNSISLNYSKLQHLVVFNEFFKLELLRIKYPSVYSLLAEKRNDFLELIKINNLNNHYKLKGYDKKSDNEPEIKRYLFDHSDNISVPNYSIDKIVNLLTSLFPFSLSDHELKELNSIVVPSKTYRYFKYAILNEDLSEVEFDEYRSRDSITFNKAITDWVKNGKEDYLRYLFYGIKAFITRPIFWTTD